MIALTRDTIRIHGITGDGAERLKEQVINLLLSFRGTIPGSRGFGLDGYYIDYPYPEASNLLAMELTEAVSSCIPGIIIRSVSFTGDGPDGTMCANITLERVGEHEY